MARPKANAKQAPAAVAAPAAVDAGQPVSETTLHATGTAAAAPEAAGVAVPAAEVQPTAPAPMQSEPVAETKVWPPAPTLVVVGPAKGRWRIGKKFGPEPVSLALGDLTEEQWIALDADPELHVTVVEAPH